MGAIWYTPMYPRRRHFRPDRFHLTNENHAKLKRNYSMPDIINPPDNKPSWQKASPPDIRSSHYVKTYVTRPEEVEIVEYDGTEDCRNSVIWMLRHMDCNVTPRDTKSVAGLNTFRIEFNDESVWHVSRGSCVVLSKDSQASGRVLVLSTETVNKFYEPKPTPTPTPKPTPTLMHTTEDTE